MSSTNLFIPIKFKTTMSLLPTEMNKNFEETLLKKIKTSLENVCSKHGYIKNNSIKIIKRSVGSFKKEHFNGNVIFDLECIAEICNPAQGSIIKCKVKAKNSLGILAEGFYDKNPILEIIIPKISAGIQSEINIEKVVIGDEIVIEVCGKKFQLFDKHISIIGRAIKNKDEEIKNIIENEKEDDDKSDDEIITIDSQHGDNYGKQNSEIIDEEEKEDDDEEEEEEEDEDEIEIDDVEDYDIEEEIEDDKDDYE
jgi:hypothetical protein